MHNDFGNIYGYNYKVNSVFFFQFYRDLEAYMSGQRDDLRGLLTKFFDDLRASIVVLMEGGAPSGSSARQQPDPEWIRCLSEGLGRQNAFNRTDENLQAQLLETYPPARMLVNALATSSRLLRSIVQAVSLSFPPPFFILF